MDVKTLVSATSGSNFDFIKKLTLSSMLILSTFSFVQNMFSMSVLTNYVTHISVAH